jgi:hypothetical protein
MSTAEDLSGSDNEKQKLSFQQKQTHHQEGNKPIHEGS